MTKKQELQVLELLIKDGQIYNGSFDDFWENYKSEFTFTWSELTPILTKYFHWGDVDANLVVQPSLQAKYQALKDEVEKENSRQQKSDGLIDDQAKLVRRQRRYFWVPIALSICALLVALLKPAPKFDDSELKEYIKNYVDSTRSEIRDDIGESKIQVLDMIEGDTTFVRKK